MFVVLASAFIDERHCSFLAHSGPNQAFNTADHQYLISIHLQRLLLCSFFSLSHIVCASQVILPL